MGKMRVLRLPRIFTIDTFYDVVRSMHELIESPDKTVFIDFLLLESIEVGGITALSNVIEYIKFKGFNVLCMNVDKCGASNFLLCSGFTETYTSIENSQLKEDPDFLKLSLVRYDRSFSYINNTLTPWLATVLKCDPRALASVKVGFEEIFNNIKDHSTVTIGCSCAHYVRGQNKVLICIADFGVGIPAKVREKIEVGSDHAAIEKACQEGFTTKSTPRNMGAGLTTLIRNIVVRNSGRVSIYSGEGVYDCLPGLGNLGTGKPAPSNYPGTVVYITIETQKFVPSDINEEDFLW